MKQVHNVRMRVNGRNQETVDTVLERGEAMARRKEDDRIDRTVHEIEGLWSGELWIDHQQPVRRFVESLKAALGAEVCALIARQPGRFLDTGTHCFIRLNRDAFLEGRYELASGGETIAIRLNIAAFPATRENTIVVLQQLFS